MYSLDDTIAAIASAPGGAARGIVRLSGPEALACFAEFFRSADGDVESLRSASASCVVAGSLHLPGLASAIPCDAYFWPGQDGRARSYTGQPTVEIHTIGSPPLLEWILRSVCERVARVAEPGEFTMRAFLAGRIDLTQAEAVLGVIDAVDSANLHVALEQLAGGLGRPLHRLRDALLELLAHVEAGFDFADEQLPFIAADELAGQLREIASQIEMIRQQMVARDDRRQAVTAVLIGRPNSGKSSLFNALAGDQAAIVSDHPGTTRDYLTVDIDLQGIRCRLVDTAGCRTLDDSSSVSEAAEIEHASQMTTTEQHRTAAVTIVCLDSTRPLDPWERRLLESPALQHSIIAATKCDLPWGTDCPNNAIRVSAVMGIGIELLLAALRETCLASTSQSGQFVAGTATRCRESLRCAGESIAHAQAVAATGQEELVAAELRVALDELGKIVGAVYTDDVLHRIFSRFCVGK